MSKLILLLIFLAVLIHPLHAQEKLSLADAVSLALKNNYAILIASNNSEIAANNNTSGNAGMLPRLSADAASTRSIDAVKQKYSSGQEVDKKDVESSNLTARAILDWTLFDGLKMFATKNKLRELQDKGDLNLKLEIENTIAAVIGMYFDIVRNKELLKATDDAMDIYEERVKISETKFNIGSSSKLDLLQAKVDLNAQRSEQLRERTMLHNSKINLNQLLARPVDIDFDVTDSMVISYHPTLEDLKKTVVNQNYSLLAAQKDLNIASNSMQEAKSQRYPTIGLGAVYDYSRAETQAGLFMLNQNTGLTYGLTVNWTLFDGFTKRNQVKNSKLDYQNYTIRLNDVRSQVEADLLKVFKIFYDDLELLKLEEENLLLAQENVLVALERYRIGKSTQVEMKDAQKSLDDAVFRTTSARYVAKLAETELMRLNGELVK